MFYKREHALLQIDPGRKVAYPAGAIAVATARLDARV